MPRPNLGLEVLPEKAWQPDTWTARHELVCDLHIAAFSNNTIAEKLDLSISRVSVILSDPRAHAYVKKHREKMSDALAESIYGRLEALAPFALDALEEDVKIQNPSIRERPIRQKAYFGALAALGYGPIQKQVSAKSVEVPPELVGRSEQVLREMREIQGVFQYSAPPTAKVEAAPVLRSDDET